ncbi:hypothetical protein ACFLVW_05595 [Chloroflexota bacterium]
MSKEAKYFAFATLCVTVGGLMLTATIIWGWAFVIVGLFFGFMALKTKHIVSNVNGVATQIITVENYDYEFKKEDDVVVLRLNPEIHASPGVRVEDIQVEIKGQRYETGWEPMKESISGDIGHCVYANLPASLKSGIYQARLVAVIKNKEYYSDDFDLEYEKSN